MEKIEFKTKGPLYQLYTMTFKGINLPEDTCSYRFRLIVSLLVSLALLPITIIRILYRIITYAITKDEEKFNNGVGGFALTFLLWIFPTVIGIGVASDWYIFGIDVMTFNLFGQLGSFFLIGVITIISILIILMILVGIGWLFIQPFKWMGNKTFDVIGDEDYKPTQFSELYWSFKEKYCKKIDWK